MESESAHPPILPLSARSQEVNLHTVDKKKKDWPSESAYLFPSPCGLRIVSMPLSFKFFHNIVIEALQPNFYLAHIYCVHII